MFSLKLYMLPNPLSHNIGCDIKAKHLNIQKACRAWGRGKRVCYDCGFLVNKDGHEEWCSAANNTRSSPPDVRGNEAPAPTGEDRHHHYEQYLKGGYEEVTERWGETIYTEHELPDVLVPTIAIPEGLTVNLSLYQQAAGEA
jgi:ribosomal protein L32